MKRYGSLIKLKPEKYDEYVRLHKAVWPRVLETISQCHIRNYSIFHRDGFLFAYYEYDGTDHDADMRKMAADPTTQKWWELTMPLQEPLASRSEGDWWTRMEELFHHD